MLKKYFTIITMLLLWSGGVLQAQDNTKLLDQITCTNIHPDHCQTVKTLLQNRGIEKGKPLPLPELTEVQNVLGQSNPPAQLQLKALNKNRGHLVIAPMLTKKWRTEISNGFLLKSNSSLTNGEDRDPKYNNRLRARISNVDLFGRGKILDIDADSIVDVTNVDNYNILLRAQYVDPALFGHDRWFMQTSAFYERFAFQSSTPGNSENEQEGGFGVGVGKRFGRYGFASLNYEYLLDALTSYGDTSTTNDDGNSHRLYAILGWDKQDSSYFPTSGSRGNIGLPFWGRFHFSLRSSAYLLSYQKTWRSGQHTFLQFRLGAEPSSALRPGFLNEIGLAFRLERTWQHWVQKPNIINARWFVETGLLQIDFVNDRDPEYRVTPGVKMGARLLETKLGLVNIYAFANHTFEW
ncbi:MAG: BamA/TamA family outer membrane protein [Bdellovibrionota bacterium]